MTLDELDKLLSAVWDGDKAAAYALIDGILEYLDDGRTLTAPRCTDLPHNKWNTYVMVERLPDTRLRVRVLDINYRVPDLHRDNISIAEFAGDAEWLYETIQQIKAARRSYIGTTVGHTAALARIEFLP